MGTKARPRPQRLAVKLLAIRQQLGVSQQIMAKLLNAQCARVSEYERAEREPNLLLLLNYARLAEVSVDYLIDDNLDLPY